MAGTLAPENFVSNVHYRAGFQGLYAQFKNGWNCDVKLIFVDSPKPVYIHKCLADIYFPKITKGADQQDCDENCLDLAKHGIPYGTGISVIEHVYTGVLKMTPEQVPYVLMAAVVLGYEELENVCLKYLREKATSGRLDTKLPLISPDCQSESSAAYTSAILSSKGTTTETTDMMRVFGDRSTKVISAPVTSKNDIFPCGVPGCRGRAQPGDKEFRIHVYPGSMKRKEEWLQAIVKKCGRKYYRPASQCLGICKYHFRPEDQVKSSLKLGAIPCIFEIKHSTIAEKKEYLAQSQEEYEVQTFEMGKSKQNKLFESEKKTLASQTGFVRKKNIYKDLDSPVVQSQMRRSQEEEIASAETSQSSLQVSDSNSDVDIPVIIKTEPLDDVDIPVIIKKEPLDNEYYTNTSQLLSVDTDIVVKREVEDQDYEPVQTGAANCFGTFFGSWNEHHEPSDGKSDLNSNMNGYTDDNLEPAFSGVSAKVLDHVSATSSHEKANVESKRKPAKTKRKVKKKIVDSETNTDSDNQEAQMFGLGLQRTNEETNDKATGPSSPKKRMTLREKCKIDYSKMMDIDFDEEIEGDEDSWEKNKLLRSTFDYFSSTVDEHQATYDKKMYFPPAGIVPKGCRSSYATGVIAKPRVVTRTLTDKFGMGLVKVERKIYPARHTLFHPEMPSNSKVFICDPVTKMAVPQKLWTTNKNNGLNSPQTKTVVVCHPTKPVVNEYGSVSQKKKAQYGIN
ncbi:uncharacterized protein LOC127878153 [Dreissena polymorpha]|uniref:THAP-type domain-containing protein n=1 Tax=Dreissena polymorpha TaxID=45954 RepID=A0A9D4K762_DREPO|nr:uncharacterized protein LOC127878153 [Dreissena polymorpha]XP_052280562.1 uncharacterized protein LOC127878153 [Dreissena polymorpha]KAH3834365.1 hypothetical protein DPMN_107687 [Dreissena polymorpha]